ncbi:HNH endonuclease [Acuticoccus sp. M5D2P5]|uniref:HNH endonuclease n=1 Tax=Acuticoccus kalidii TaxID=2910977 RepID=UPI001F16BE20|nr:HNH endonuclease [Acuticoccus kalidii]MCF3932890.1 HNH endonuclease [Acuticoccus kalidii]
MSRREFSKPVRREMLQRSGGKCEAKGELFGLAEGVRCNADLAYGVRFEHVLPDYIGGAPTPENGAAVCPKCWRWKTDNHDRPIADKTRRVSEKRQGLRQKRSSFPTARTGSWKGKIGGGVERR